MPFTYCIPTLGAFIARSLHLRPLAEVLSRLLCWASLSWAVGGGGEGEQGETKILSSSGSVPSNFPLLALPHLPPSTLGPIKLSETFVLDSLNSERTLSSALTHPTLPWCAFPTGKREEADWRLLLFQSLAYTMAVSD